MNFKRTTLFFLSSLTGILLWLSWPAHGFTPLIFFAFIPLLYVNHHFVQHNVRRRNLKAFLHFYWAMLLWNALTTWWIYNSTDVGSFLAIGLNSLFMAFIWQLIFITKKRLGTGLGYVSVFFFWMAFEYLHLNWDISWPWLTLGNVFTIHPEYVQWYEYTGVLGGTLWALAANLFFFALSRTFIHRDLLAQLRRVNAMLIMTACAVLIITPMIFSVILYKKYVRKGTPVEVAVVQPNVDPYHEKFSGNGAEQLSHMLQLASSVIESNTKIVVFPETALPDGIWEEDLSEHPQIITLKKFARAFPNTSIIIGAATYKAYYSGDSLSPTARPYEGRKSDGVVAWDAYNTALLIDTAGIQIYHKTRLVPGVEKMPYPKVFGFLEDYAISLGGTSGSLASDKERNVFIAADGLKIAPAICYESIYGDFMSHYMKQGAQLIVVITNDGWWGNTPGYRQHEQYARLLAIEFRKGIARSANTGISCFINQRGDVLKETEWWTEDAISDVLMQNNIKTFYARHGDYLGVIAAYGTGLLILILIGTLILKRRHSKPTSF